MYKSNNTWSEEEIINKDGFVNRIALDSVVIYSDLNAECSADFYYSDGELFAGHFIVISTNSNNQLENAYLAG